MKTILRIFIILIVAIAIGGITLALVNTNGSAASAGQARDGFDRLQFVPVGNSATGQLPAGTNGNFHPDRGSRFDGGSFSWFGIIGNLLIIAAVVAVVALFERLLKATRRQKLARVPVGSSEGERKE